MAKRKSLTKKIRFEVLKRDQFTCQYCGAKAPDVLLEVDHIKPVALGGINDILNLITSCQPCNAGKKDRPLSDQSALAKSRTQAQEIQSRKEQIEMMAAWQSSLVDLQAQQVEAAHEIVKKLMPGRILSEESLRQLRKYINEHGFEPVVSQFRTSFACLGKWKDDGCVDAEATSKAITHAFKALQWKKLNDSNPLESQARYIRGILRRRLSYLPMDASLGLARVALEEGLEFSELKRVAVSCSSWTNFSDLVTDMRESV